MDMNAFSFLTLYLMHSANEQLNKNPDSLFEVIDKLKRVLNELSIEYPPSSIQKTLDEGATKVGSVSDDRITWQRAWQKT